MSSIPPPSQPVPLQNSNTAVLSLVAGISGLTIFPIFGSIVAVVLGHMAKGEISRSGGMLGGDGAATWGLILGYVGIGLTVLGLCAAGLVIAGACTIPFLVELQQSSWAPVLLAA